MSENNKETQKEWEWMKLKETAEYLQISQTSLYRMLTSKKIPASKVGRQWRFNRTRIEQWLETEDIMLKDVVENNKGEEN
ncbi:helix-turn-helix domain-containing protein [bacterium]|nr:helix-turn-helix domain-containing protein [Candidatus Omnitrophota bacterium]MBU4123813.1 helix-turn-helix domain-containing protein [bacterium]